MPPQRLTPDHDRRLTTEFKFAFKVVELVQLAKHHVSGFIPEEMDPRNISHFLIDLFRMLDNRCAWVPFLTAARLDRETNGALVVVVDEVLAYFNSPSVDGAPADPLTSIVLHHRKPFVDRKAVREAFSEMDRDDGWCGLVVTGPKQVGKTYCQNYLTYLRMKKWTGDRCAHVVLGEQRGYSMSLRELVRQLVLALLPPYEPLPEPQPRSEEVRWASDLAVWLAARIDRTGGRVWVALDGFDHPDVPEATHTFIGALVEEAAQRANLRVLLFGYDRYASVVPDHALSGLKWVPLNYLTADELQEFFDEMERRRPFRALPQYALDAQPADQFVQGYRSLPGVGGALQARVLKEALPKVVGRLLDITGGTR